MDIRSIPLIDFEGNISKEECTECRQQARVKYAVRSAKFKLCLSCLMQMERSTQEVLHRLLSERQH